MEPVALPVAGSKVISALLDVEGAVDGVEGVDEGEVDFAAGGVEGEACAARGGMRGGGD